MHTPPLEGGLHPPCAVLVCVRGLSGSVEWEDHGLWSDENRLSVSSLLPACLFLDELLYL